MTWELGLNLGHLARLLPVASRLREEGHEVLVAARDLAAAARVLQFAGIPFVQAPHLTRQHQLPHRPAGYSDILRANGWGDRTTLAGLTEAWINLFGMFRPDIVLADYSPTATFAAHLRHLPYLLVGNGFELPPATAPFPPDPFRMESIRFFSFPVDLQPLLNADLCITYGAEGTMMRFIMSGVPQLIWPGHVEAYIAARRIEAAGLGLTADKRSAEKSIGRLIADPSIKQAVNAFAKRAATPEILRSAEAAVDALDALLQMGVAH
jgi:UDP:flavonoid glycosyltransferase YjiC (YdhE family)